MIFNYFYYRAYCFYRKYGGGVDPHIWASVVPSFIVVSIIYGGYFLGVKHKLLPWIHFNIMVAFLSLLLLFYIMEKVYEGQIENFDRKWGREKGSVRVAKGTAVAIVSVVAFFSIFIYANEIRKLKPFLE